MSKGNHPEVDQALNNLHEAQGKLSAYIDVLRKARQVDFDAKGGCPDCHGYGTVLTWSTLDGPGWDEFGPCLNPTCTAKVTGPNPTKGRPGSGWNHGGVDPDNFPSTPAEESAYKAAKDLVQQMEDNVHNLRDKWTPSKGKVVKVVGGRKVPKGTEGEVFWVGQDSFGTPKLGIKDAKGTVHWTTSNNVEVVNPVVPEPTKVIVVGVFLRESVKAYFADFNGKQLWLPKSQVKKLNNVAFLVPTWLAEKNNLKTKKA